MNLCPGSQVSSWRLGPALFLALILAVSPAALAQDRIISPAVTSADMATLAAGNTAFAFDLFQALRQGPGNLFLSPYSISLALAMTYGGARAETARQMASVLHFSLSQTRLHPAFNALDQELARREQTAAGQGQGQGFRLNVANSIWGQNGFPFRADYLDLLADNYGAGLRLADFIRTPDNSRRTINRWVSERTQGKIAELLPPGSINSLTRLVLANAIYFRASWSEPFATRQTRSGPFTLLSGARVSATMMRQTARFRHASAGDWAAVELPYLGRQVAMILIVPAAGRFESFQASLTANRAAQIIGALSSKQVDLTMPRFTFRSSFSLRPTLAGLGMPLAFSPGADFRGMADSDELFISDVFHKGFVAVNEAGTEAAAATGVVVGITATPGRAELVVNRPFFFLIRDNPTGSILFLGRVLNPTA